MRTFKPSLVMNCFSLASLLVAFSLLFVSCGRKSSQSYQSFRQTQKQFETSAGSMAYQDQGEGSPIILLHGVPTSSWMYRKVIPGLAEKHRVIAVDLIGYGSSAKPKDDPAAYRPAEQARRVRQLAKKLGLTNYSLMFHDMGGLVAWEMLRQDSDAISNLIVLNTIVHKDGFNPPEFKPGVMTGLLSKSLANRWSNQTTLALIFRNLGLTSDYRLNSGECSGYVEPLREGSEEALYEFYTSLNPSLYTRLEQNKPYLRKFKGRTLVLWGEKDEILSTQQIPFLSENLRIHTNDIHVYRKHEHFLAEEAPKELVRQVTEFLAE